MMLGDLYENSVGNAQICISDKDDDDDDDNNNNNNTCYAYISGI